MDRLVTTAMVILTTFLAPSIASAEQFYRGHSEYEAPIECRQRMNKVCRVPESVFIQLTQEEKAWAYAYAKEHSIPWIIVRARHSLHAKGHSLY